MLCTPLYPMVLLIIIPIKKWLAIIGNINPTFSVTNPYYNNDIPIFCPAVATKPMYINRWRRLLRDLSASGIFPIQDLKSCRKGMKIDGFPWITPWFTVVFHTKNHGKSTRNFSVGEVNYFDWAMLSIAMLLNVELIFTNDVGLPKRAGMETGIKWAECFISWETQATLSLRRPGVCDKVGIKWE